MKKTKKILTGISRVKNDDGVRVELASLSRKERNKYARIIERNVITASAAYHGYTVEFEGNTAILTPR